MSGEFVECSTQAQLDQAVADGHYPIVRSGWFRASDSASVEAYGSASVQAYGSASVQASGSASVRAYDSASVQASGSASVRASGSASVRASGSASVRAYDSASVEAYDSASVRAYDSASVQASRYVAVHKHRTPYGEPTVKGGVLIEVPYIDTFADWCDFHGLARHRKQPVVFKAVDDNLTSGHGHTYPIGEKVTCDDWSPEASCGNGLHFSQTPHHATRYQSDATRWLACAVPAASVLIDSGIGADKVKAPSCRVLYEVDRDGNRVEARA